MRLINILKSSIPEMIELIRAKRVVREFERNPARYNKKHHNSDDALYEFQEVTLAYLRIEDYKYKNK